MSDLFNNSDNTNEQNGTFQENGQPESNDGAPEGGTHIPEEGGASFVNDSAYNRASAEEAAPSGSSPSPSSSENQPPEERVDAAGDGGPSYSNPPRGDRSGEARDNSPYTYSYTKDSLYGEGKTAVNPSGESPRGAYYGADRSYGQGASADGYAHRPYTYGNSYSQSTFGSNQGQGSGGCGATGAQYGGQGQSGASVQNPQYGAKPSRKAPKQKKKVTLTASAAVILCVSCIVLSLAAGILGAALVNNGFYADSVGSGNEGNHAASGTDENGNVVLYRAVDTVKEDGGDMTLPEVANLVSDSVVEITTEYVSNENYYFGQYVTEGAGSGVIISADGYIVTNNHVIYNSDSGKIADTINVRLRSGTEYTAELIGRDSDSDIAVLKIDADDLAAAVWGDSSKLVVGQDIIVVGNPLGELGGTVTNGIVSATSREVEVENVKMTLIQTNAAVNPGNSGGGMFNSNGELVGVVNAKSSGTGVEGLGFAIPSNDARDIVEQLLNYGYVKGKVFIGVSFYEANSGYYFYSGDTGVLYVYGVEEGYNDDVLQAKDIVLSIDGKEVSTAADVKAILKEHNVGDKLTFSILRNKTAMDVEVTCYEYNPSGSSVSFNEN